MRKHKSISSSFKFLDVGIMFPLKYVGILTDVNINGSTSKICSKYYRLPILFVKRFSSGSGVIVFYAYYSDTRGDVKDSSSHLLDKQFHFPFLSSIDKYLFDEYEYGFKRIVHIVLFHRGVIYNRWS